MRQVKVNLGERSYPVLVGPGARHELGSVVPAGSRKAAVVSQAPVGVTVEAGVQQRTFLIGDGEEAKSLRTVEELCRGFAEFGLTRADLVVGVGGGVVTDVAGFAAAVYHRGVSVAHVATTLLAQVDAAIGGKTGVNLPEGKNLVGAFWQPTAVLCDIEVLASLPPREYRSGLGEMAKYAFLGVPDLTKLDLEEAVARCVECKAEVVADDERETEALARTGAGVTGPAVVAGPCSTTATRSRTPWRQWAATTCATARLSPSAWSSPPTWPAGSAASATSASLSTKRSWRPTTCPRGYPRYRPERGHERDGPGQEGRGRGARRSCSTAPAGLEVVRGVA